MRKTLLMIVSLLVGVAVLGGCEEQRAAAQRDLDAAIAQIDAAERGYGEKDDEPYQTYRNRALDQAAPKLRSVLSNGSSRQKVVAGRQLAQIELSMARYQTRQALTDYAGLASRSASMIHYLNAVTAADARAIAARQDAQAVILQLNEEINSQNVRRDQLTAETDRLRGKLAGVEAERDRHRESAQNQMAEARRLSEQAFVTRGDPHYDLLDQAAEAQRAASVSAAEADKQAAQAEKVQVAIQLNQTELSGVEQVIEGLNRRLVDTKAQEQKRAQSLAAANDDRTLAVDELMTQFNAINQAYNDQVDATLDGASEHAAEAQALLERARAAADARQRSAIRSGLLSATVDRAHVLTEQIIVSTGFANTLGVIVDHSERMKLAHADEFRAALDKVVAKRDELIAELNTIVTGGKELAGDMNDETSPAQSERLTAYQQRVGGLN